MTETQYKKLVRLPSNGVVHTSHGWHSIIDGWICGERRGVTWPIPESFLGIKLEIHSLNPKVELVPVEMLTPPFNEFPGRKTLSDAIEEWLLGSKFVLEVTFDNPGVVEVFGVVLA